MKLLLVLLIICVIYLWLIHPRLSRQERQHCRRLARNHFAHRGLHDRRAGIPENSMAAFRRAVEAGYGIELDVHLTADGHLVVFHDESLRRMCGVDGEVEECTLSQLEPLRLAGTGSGIPLLSSVLEMVDGRVPLLIEMKLPGRDISLCPVLAGMLREYKGEYLIESFNPFGVRWFRRHCPGVPVGQLSARYTPEDPNSGLLKFLSTTLLMNTVSRPDFVAYDCRFTDVLGLRFNRHLFRAPVFVWTIRTEEEYRRCAGRFDGIIFENIRPAQNHAEFG